MTQAAQATPNTLFPGRPDYVGPTTGWFCLLHHTMLYEHSHDVMERVEYVKSKKPRHEVATRLHNMIYLPVEFAMKRAALYADYSAKIDALDDDDDAKRAPVNAEILAYIRAHIPDCAWDEINQTLIFPES